MKTFETERELVAAVCRLVKRLGCSVPNPDYFASGQYSPQWRVVGSSHEYKLPSAQGGLTVARRARERGTYKYVFDPRGLAVRP